MGASVVAGLPHPDDQSFKREIGLSEFWVRSREGTTGGALNETFGFCSWRIGIWLCRFDTGTGGFLRHALRAELLPDLVE